MIKNERQYRITRNQADRFSQTLDSLRGRSRQSTEGAHPLIAKAQEDAIRSQLEDLEGQLREYESLKAGNFELRDLHIVAELPTALIKARIARGLSQKDLAERLKLKEQQIQRYEATDYASASLNRIREVVNALGVGTRDSAAAAGSR
ncbi:MAG: helix-turn-helix domain-containing protein [Chloroflexi bacterium]|nr:helix-turn-helix domain-containing protein [Chloroflexota bacterium]